VWCDITAKLIIGLSTALPAASLCINRRLYNIATIQQVIVSSAQKRREIMIDLFIGIGIPVLAMALHYIVQGHRYNILEDIGCWPSTYNTHPAIPLVMVPPILLGMASFVYCALSIRAFMKRRASFNAFLNSNNSGVNISRYFRLMALASIEMIFSLPMSIYHLVQDVRDAPLYPWISWEDTHWGFDRVDFIPFAYFRRSPTLWIDIQIGRWSLPFGGFIFFIFFGLAPEARKNYARLYYAAVRPLGIVPSPVSASSPPSWFSRVTGRNSAAGAAVVSLPHLPMSTKHSATTSIPDVTTPAFDELKFPASESGVRGVSDSESDTYSVSHARMSLEARDTPQT